MHTQSDNLTHVSAQFLQGWIKEEDIQALEQGKQVLKCTPYNGTETGGRVLKIVKGGLHYATIQVLQ
jgi:6-phosphogluconate dehydrogenase